MYAIADEPHETPWRHLVVNPSGPLLAEMTCGSWLSIPWFAFNAIAMGSPTKIKEAAMCVAAFAVTAVAALLLIWAIDTDIIVSTTVIRLCVLAIITWKLAIAYWIHTIQSRTFHVYEYYGGAVRSASAVLATGYVLRGFIVGAVDHPVWRIIVSGFDVVRGGGVW
jgi:hypothetical protein